MKGGLGCERALNKGIDVCHPVNIQENAIHSNKICSKILAPIQYVGIVPCEVRPYRRLYIITLF